jgi:hypothetical protein
MRVVVTVTLDVVDLHFERKKQEAPTELGDKTSQVVTEEVKKDLREYYLNIS